MNQRIILTLLCTTFLIEGIRSDGVADQISQLDSAKAKVDDALKFGENLLRQSRKIISQTITEAKTLLPKSEDASFEFSEDDLEKKLDDCGKCRDLDLLELDFTSLRFIKKRLSNCFRLCLNQQSFDAVIGCATEEVAKNVRKIEDVRSKFSSTCEKATKKVSECTQEIVKSLEKFIVIPRF